MFAWSGFGWLGYVIIFGSYFVVAGVLDSAFGSGWAREHSITVVALSFAVSSVACWPIGRFFNYHLPIRVFDADWAWRGRTTAHSMFFVRLEFASLAGLPVFIVAALHK